MLLPQIITTLLPFLLPSPPASSQPPTATPPNTLTFRPTHAHYTHPNTTTLYFHSPSQPLFNPLASDLPPSTSLAPASAELSILTRKIVIRKPLHPPHTARWAKQEWEDTEVDAPDVEDRETLRSLAKMASNAYVEPESSEWWPLEDWNTTEPFGWEKDADGLRGHIFADETNSTVIIAIKGTSAGFFGSGGPTAKNDKFNDNLLFSCCCARVDFSWSPVCGCYAGGYKCEQTCLEEALVGESVYTAVGTNLYNNVSYLYPHANIWLVGHSLGGSLSSLIGLTFGSPVVTFEAPGERLAASRLHLPLPPGVPSERTGVVHVYHTADPIPMGVCTGAYSGCYAAGYALESKCHAGQSIIYDTVTKLGWAVDIRTHRIGELINKVLAEDWDAPPDSDGTPEPDDDPWGYKTIRSVFWPGRKGPPKGGEPERKPREGKNPNAVPKAESEDECVDCFRWEFGDNMTTEPPTTTKNMGPVQIQTGKTRAKPKRKVVRP